MGREISTTSKFGMGAPQSEAWLDPAWTLGLWIAAIALFTVNLGTLPLRDWDEGIVAQIAREMATGPSDLLAWLHPKDMTGSPYFNKPPLMHWLVALSYRIGGVNEWTSRLPGALLTASSVPLLYWIGREIFFQRSVAVLSGFVYLTMLPVVRQGRLAMLDGAVVCFFLWMMFCLLRSRRNLRWGLGVGLGFGLICLTKGILGFLLAAVAIAFIAWDTPRLLTSMYLWIGLVLGFAPVACWYGAQIQQYGITFVQTHFLNQSLNRVGEAVGSNRGDSWFYLWEILKYGVPWILFLPQGFRYAWDNRNLSWAKLVLVWSAIYFGVISLMQTKLPWYAMPLYPALALVAGAQLNRMWQPPIAPLQPFRPVSRPRIWVGIFAGLALIAWSAAAYYAFWMRAEADLQLIFSTLALTLTITAILIARQDPQLIAVLIWGTYLTLLLLMLSHHWIWELEEAYPVKPVANLIRERTPKGQTVYTSYPYHRPSLNFYSQRLVIPVPEKVWRERFERFERDEQPYLLLTQVERDKMFLQKQRRDLGTSGEWALISSDEAYRSNKLMMESEKQKQQTQKGTGKKKATPQASPRTAR
jgi:4-amino-4-deoxy-L-arabinose transferase-like glycosyltransferase